MNKKTLYTNRDGNGRFIKGVKPTQHRIGCKCFRCSPFWKGKKRSDGFKKKISDLQRKKVGLDEYRNKEWLNKKYWDEKKSFEKIAKEIGVTASWVQKWMGKFNIPRRTEDYGKVGRGDKNPRWKGGNYQIKSGYKYVMVDYSHPRATRRSKYSSYIPEQYLVVEKKIGRYLKKGEVVHHKDGDKSNNKLSNLKLFKSSSEHISHEQKILLFSKQLIWGRLRPELKKELQELFKNFSKN